LAKLPTGGNPNLGVGDGLNTTGLAVPITSNTDRRAYTSRVDFDINERNSINAVINFKKEYLQRTDLLAQQGGAGCCYTQTPFGYQDAHTPFVVLAWRWAPTNSLSNEVRGGWQKSDPIFGNTIPQPSYYIQVPLINNPETGFDPQGRRTVIANVQDNAVWVKGNHAIRFGGQYDQFRADPFGPGAFGQSYLPDYVIGGGLTPVFTTTNFGTATGCVTTANLPTTGNNCISSVGTANSLLALLGGLIGGANQTFTAVAQNSPLAAAPPAHKLDYEHYGFYATDQFRVSPTLTVNFGMRYELFTPIREPNGIAIEPIIVGGDVRSSVLNPAGGYQFVGGNAGGHNFFKTDKNNIAPVVSFAWSPNFEKGFLSKLMPGQGKTVIRGGYRLSYVNDEFVRAADNALIGNAGLTSQLTIPTGATSGSLNARFNALPTFSAPTLSFPLSYSQNNTLAGNFGTVFAIDPDLKIPGSHEFSIGIQREIGFQTAFEARYVHSQSNTLVRGLDLNQESFSPAFLADFFRARANITNFGTGGVNCTAGQIATNGQACQPLQVLNQAPFNTSVFGNPLGFSNSLNPIISGAVGDLANVYISTFQIRGASQAFLANPNTGVVDLLTNGARSNYNAMQLELRRRFANGFSYQANYTFGKLLTDAPGTGQTRFEPRIDNNRPQIEYGIGDQDTTHVFNLNAIYELPFGKGKTFLNSENGVLDRIVSGWQLTSIMRITSGTPITIADPTATFNRAGRSGRQTATTNLTKGEVKALLGTFRTPCGIFWINPKVLNIDPAQCANGLIRSYAGISSTLAGRAALGYAPISGSANGALPATFPGQVFFNNSPGQVGNMELGFLRGPAFFSWDASLIKSIPITERIRFQMRAEAFNLLNRVSFAPNAQFASINSTSFGRSTGASVGSRIIQFVGRLEF